LRLVLHLYKNADDTKNARKRDRSVAKVEAVLLDAPTEPPSVVVLCAFGFREYMFTIQPDIPTSVL
jgi:hypothetical protein